MPTQIPFPLRLAFAALLAGGSARAEVIFSGLDEAQETNARALTTLAAASCDSAKWRIERLFRDADAEIRGALEALGYYSLSIRKSLSWNESCWAAEFNIDPGEPVRLRDVSLDFDGPARQDQEFLRRIETGRPATGQILHHGAYENFKRRVIDSANGRGYFEAEFETSQIRVDRNENFADLSLSLSSGPRYGISEVSFSDGILSEELLQRYTDIEPGDPYRADNINELYEVLSGSGYFRSVSISTEPLNTELKTVPVDISLTPGVRRAYSVGAGFATDTGPQARLGYTNRRRNEKGHQFESNLFWSSVESKITATYRLPLSDPRHDWFSINGGVQHEDTETSDSDTFKIGLARTHKVAENWLRTEYLDFELEDFKVGDQDETSRLLIPGVNWESAFGRELSRVSGGHRLNVDIRGASDFLLSDTSFLQSRTRAKWIHSFSPRVRLLTRIHLGVTAKESLAELPPSVRFFAGGDNSVRGYAYESLGPTDSNGQVIGGSNVIDGSIEFDYSVLPQWSVAFFADSGSAFNGTDIDLSTGIGIGARWYSPIGPIRLDFAHPLDDPDSNLRIHISLGPDL